MSGSKAADLEIRHPVAGLQAVALADLDHAAFAEVLRSLEQAWNAGDAAAFGAAMAEDADFVTIRADHLRGREAIVASHAHIFSTIYAGSRNRISIESVRRLSEDVAVLHARCVLDAPTGPLAGRHEATLSSVVLRGGGTWTIMSFHITLAPQTRHEQGSIDS